MVQAPNAPVKLAHDLHREGTKSRIRIILYEDGTIRCCSVVDDAEKCCYQTPEAEGEESYFAVQKSLVQRGYEAEQLSDLSGVAPQQKECSGCQALESLKHYIERRALEQHA